MSNYAKWWDKTITVYNKYTDPTTSLITWYRRVLIGCFWYENHKSVMVGNTKLETNSTVVRIPKNSIFLERAFWELSESKGTHFTLSVGDIIMLGEISESINEYSSGHRSTDIINKYKGNGLLTVDKYANNTGECRCLEHYFVSGV